MKKTLSALFTTCSLMATPTIAAEAHISVGAFAPNSPQTLLHFNDLTMETCKAKGIELVEAAGIGYEANIICVPGKDDLVQDSTLKTKAYYCLRTDGPTICLDR